MKVQHNRFKLDCLWKGAIQQTETKQSKSISLSSCHLYVRVIGSLGKGRGFKRQQGICGWERVVYIWSGT